MNRSKLIAVVFLGLLTNVAGGDVTNPAEGPRGPAPRRAVVIDVETGDAIFTATESVTANQAVYEEKTVTKDGKQVKVVEVTYRPVTKEIKVRYDLSAFEITRPDGQQLTREEVLKRMKPGSVLLISADGKPFDPRQLQGIKGDALILVPIPRDDPEN